VEAAIASDFPELAGLNHFASAPEYGVAQIVEPDLRSYAGGLGRLRHAARSRAPGSEELFAINVFACANRRQSHFLMKSIRGGDIDHLDLAIKADLPRVGRLAGEAELRSRPSGDRLGHIGNSAHLNDERRVEGWRSLSLALSESPSIHHERRIDTSIQIVNSIRDGADRHPFAALGGQARDMWRQDYVVVGK
jgi:hypothetical protein